jgi:hypothetical protein
MSKARDIASATPAPSTVSSAELGYLDGVTSAIQTQVDAKQAVVSGVDDTEIGYLDGVTSAIQTQVDAKIPNTLTTTTGDIIYASGADTPARLAVGSTDDVLTVAGGVPTWAAPAGGGGKNYSLLGTADLSGVNTYTVTGLAGYDSIFLRFEYVTCYDTGGNSTYIRLNSITSGYTQNAMTLTNTSYTTQSVSSAIVSVAYLKLMSNGSSNLQSLHGYMKIEGANTSGIKIIEYAGGVNDNGAMLLIGGGVSTDSATVSSVTIATDGTGNFKPSSKMYVYGAV